MVLTGEKATIRRAQICEAALREISAKGISNVTIDSIAKAAGLSKGGVTYYFKSKEHILEAVFVEFFDFIFLRSKDTMGKCTDPLSKLLSFDWLYDWEDPDVNTGYPLLFDFMAASCHDDRYKAIFHEWVNNWVELLQEAIIEGNNAGIINCPDPASIAKAISAVYHGLAVRWYLDRNSHSKQWAVSSYKEAIKGLLNLNSDRQTT